MIISDSEARRVASQWHGGGGTALYAFASTGAIDTARANHNLWSEISAEIRTIGPWSDNLLQSYTDLTSLRHYVECTGKRGPVPGWADLTR